MSLYETITKRRSVRKFNKTPLEEDVLKDVSKFLEDTKQIEGQKAMFGVVSAEAVKGPAPHYILAYGEEGDAAYINVGYVLQKTDLYIQGKGLGSLYLGVKKPVIKSDDFLMMTAFGASDVPFRKGEQDFDRLPINEICSVDNSVSRAARLAPSARNYQPWKLTIRENDVKIDYFGRGALKSMFRGRLAMIDIGIVTSHVELALIDEGKKVTSIVPKPDGKGISVTISFE